MKKLSFAKNTADALSAPAPTDAMSCSTSVSQEMELPYYGMVNEGKRMSVGPGQGLKICFRDFLQVQERY